ncbi:hypothetical protein BRC62_02800, partial [Halobacteriales archaeon QH_10_67_13]
MGRTSDQIPRFEHTTAGTGHVSDDSPDRRSAVDATPVLSRLLRYFGGALGQRTLVRPRNHNRNWNRRQRS